MYAFSRKINIYYSILFISKLSLATDFFFCKKMDLAYPKEQATEIWSDSDESLPNQGKLASFTLILECDAVRGVMKFQSGPRKNKRKKQILFSAI